MAKNDVSKELLEFTESGESKAAKKALELLELMRQPSFKATDFLARSVAFLTAEPANLESVKEQMYDYCQQCKTLGTPVAVQNLKCIVDRYISEGFKIDCDSLTYIGIQLGKSGYDDYAIRCFERAKALITD